MVVTVHIPDTMFSRGTEIQHVAARLVGPERDTTVSATVLSVVPDRESRLFPVCRHTRKFLAH